MAGRHGILGALALALLVAGCGGSEPSRLMNLQSTHNGPDEFSILPTKPLEIPKDLSSLPPPMPGASNLVDVDPLSDAVIALGGKPQAGTSDQALVAAAGRHGVAANIRTELAQEDAAFRAKQSPRLMERLFGTSTYHRAYAGETLDSDATLRGAREIDRRTPSVVPPYAR